MTSIQLFKLSFVCSDLTHFTKILFKSIEKKHKVTVYPTTMNEVSEAYLNKDVSKKLNQYTYLTMDGMPLVWLAHLKEQRSAERIYGPDLLLKMCELGQQEHIKHFFYGTTSITLENLITKLQMKFPQLIVAGTLSPPFRKLKPSENEAIISQINKTNTDILWVSLGSTKQLSWIIDNREQLLCPVIVAVGAAFDFLSGQKRQAPYLIRSIGLEWMFRLVQEPSRLWPRYVKKFPIMIFLILKEILNTKK